MKKLLALLAVFALLIPCAVSAEGNYLRQLPQSRYTLTNLIAPEDYPEVVLTTDAVYKRFGRSSEGSSLYLVFPGPGGALANRVEYDDAHFLDVDRLIQYSYQLVSSDSYEEFLNKAENDEFILLDGSGKTAAYVDPGRGRAYGMIGVTEFGKSAKLRITISLDGLGRNDTEATKVKALSDAILPEVERVKQSMKTERRETTWNAGAFDGMKMLSPYDAGYMLKLDFPVFTVSGTEARMVVTRVVDSSMNGLYFFEPGTYLEMEFKLDDYAYSAIKLAEGDENTYKLTLTNGSEWIIYWANAREDGSSSYIHCAKVVPTPANMPSYMKDETEYVTLLLDGEHITWQKEDLAEDLLKIDEAITIMNAEDDPYVPAPVQPETPAPETPAQEEKQADGTWTCPVCGTEGNTGKFCPECAAPKPEESAEWTCPVCGTEGNTGKFCPECAAPKP